MCVPSPCCETPCIGRHTVIKWCLRDRTGNNVGVMTHAITYLRSTGATYKANSVLHNTPGARIHH